MVNDKCFLAGRQMREQKMSQANYSSDEWLQVMQEEEECVGSIISAVPAVTRLGSRTTSPYCCTGIVTAFIRWLNFL